MTPEELDENRMTRDEIENSVELARRLVRSWDERKKTPEYGDRAYLDGCQIALALLFTKKERDDALALLEREAAEVLRLGAKLDRAEAVCRAVEQYRKAFQGGGEAAVLPSSIRFSEAPAARDELERALAAWRGGGG